MRPLVRHLIRRLPLRRGAALALALGLFLGLSREQPAAEEPRRSSWSFLPVAEPQADEPRPVRLGELPRRDSQAAAESAMPGAARLLPDKIQLPDDIQPLPNDVLPLPEDTESPPADEPAADAVPPPLAPPMPTHVPPPRMPPALLYPPVPETFGDLDPSAPYDAATGSEPQSFDAACEECEEPSWCDHLGCLSPGRWLPDPPEVTQAWYARPLRVGLFLSVLEGDELIQGQVDQGNGALGGLRLGCDLDDYWGLEGRLGFGSADVENLTGPADVRSGQLTVADLSVLYYPWSSPRWRPFLSAGFGMAWFDFRDRQGETIDNSTPSFPIGFGVSYRIDDAAALRLELFDTIAVGDGSELDTTHNVTFGAALEYRFGGPRRSYWPWEPPPRVW